MSDNEFDASYMTTDDECTDGECDDVYVNHNNNPEHDNNNPEHDNSLDNELPAGRWTASEHDSHTSLVTHHAVEKLCGCQMYRIVTMHEIEDEELFAHLTPAALQRVLATDTTDDDLDNLPAADAAEDYDPPGFEKTLSKIKHMEEFQAEFQALLNFDMFTNWFKNCVKTSKGWWKTYDEDKFSVECGEKSRVDIVVCYLRHYQQNTPGLDFDRIDLPPKTLPPKTPGPPAEPTLSRATPFKQLERPHKRLYCDSCVCEACECYLSREESCNPVKAWNSLGDLPTQKRLQIPPTYLLPRGWQEMSDYDRQRQIRIFAVNGGVLRGLGLEKANEDGEEANEDGDQYLGYKPNMVLLCPNAAAKKKAKVEREKEKEAEKEVKAAEKEAKKEAKAAEKAAEKEAKKEAKAEARAVEKAAKTAAKAAEKAAWQEANAAEKAWKEANSVATITKAKNKPMNPNPKSDTSKSYWWSDVDGMESNKLLFHPTELPPRLMDNNSHPRNSLEPHVYSLRKGGLEGTTAQPAYKHVNVHFRNPGNHKNAKHQTDITAASNFLGYQVQPNYGANNGGMKNFGHVKYSMLGAIMCAASKLDVRLQERHSIRQWVAYMCNAQKAGHESGQKAAEKWLDEVSDAVKQIPASTSFDKRGRKRSGFTQAREIHAHNIGYFGTDTPDLDNLVGELNTETDFFEMLGD
jgi:hypothetical protein